MRTLLLAGAAKGEAKPEAKAEPKKADAKK